MEFMKATGYTPTETRVHVLFSEKDIGIEPGQTRDPTMGFLLYQTEARIMNLSPFIYRKKRKKYINPPFIRKWIVNPTDDPSTPGYDPNYGRLFIYDNSDHQKKRIEAWNKLDFIILVDKDWKNEKRI